MRGYGAVQPPPVFGSPRPMQRLSTAQPVRRRSAHTADRMAAPTAPVAAAVRARRGVTGPQRPPGRRANSLPRQQHTAATRRAQRPSVADEPTPPQVHAPVQVEPARRGRDYRSYSAPRPRATSPRTRFDAPQPHLWRAAAARVYVSPHRAPPAATAGTGGHMKSPRARPSPRNAEHANTSAADTSGMTAPQAGLEEGVDKMSLEQLWVALKLHDGKLSLAVEGEQGQLADQTLSASSARLILKHWCSPNWVFKSQKPYLVLKRKAAQDSQKLKTLYLEHTARRRAGGSIAGTTDAFSQEGHIVDQFFETCQTQAGVIHTLSEELAAAREKCGTLRVCADGFRAQLEACEAEKRTLARQLEKTRDRASHILTPDDFDTALPPRTPVSPGRKDADRCKPTHAECIQLEGKIGVLESLLINESTARRSAESRLATLVDTDEFRPHSPSSAAPVVAQAVSATRIGLRRLDALLRQRESELSKLRERLGDSESKLACIRERQSPRAGSDPPEHYQRRLHAVRQQAEQARAATVFERLVDHAVQLGKTHDAVLDEIQGGEGACLGLALSQLERCDGSVSKAEWLSWFEALGAIGQAPDRTLGVIEDRLDAMEAAVLMPAEAPPSPHRVAAAAVSETAVLSPPQQQHRGKPQSVASFADVMKQLQQLFAVAAKGADEQKKRKRPRKGTGRSGRGSPDSQCSSPGSGSSNLSTPKASSPCDRVALLGALRSKDYRQILNTPVLGPPGLNAAGLGSLRSAFEASVSRGGNTATIEALSVRIEEERSRYASGNLPPASRLFRGLPPGSLVSWCEVEGRATKLILADAPAGKPAPKNWGELLIQALVRNAAVPTIRWHEFAQAMRESMTDTIPIPSPESMPPAVTSPARLTPQSAGGSVSSPSEEW
eukprot:TRINITY_DN3610_c0_g1_i1.p1 TRINITY_DN3610_c0_g1~~TRINITY_DN3610_c0_g1_i1.p1  ORF type:complete len:896 (+),score=116.93 TRINITY_DN3610_c0_g1_i1:84-2771(+)